MREIMNIVNESQKSAIVENAQESVTVLGSVEPGPSADLISDLRDADVSGVDLRVEQRGPDRLKINWIGAHQPHGRRGSAAMRLLCELADQHGVTLRLQPFADDDRTLKFLIGWYRTFGFRKGEDGLMFRKPLRK